MHVVTGAYLGVKAKNCNKQQKSPPELNTLSSDVMLDNSDSESESSPEDADSDGEDEGERAVRRPRDHNQELINVLGSESEEVLWEPEEVEDGEDDASESTLNDAIILLPTAISARSVMDLGLGQWATYELELQEGQANDALERLRNCLAQRALIQRRDLRHAKATKQKTRLWSDLNALQVKVRRFCFSSKLY